MTARGLPSPLVTLTSDDQRVAGPWYQYLKSADATWRPTLQVISSGTTTNTLIPKDGVTLVLDPSTHTLANPEPGVTKTIVVVSASTTTRINAATTTTTIANISGTGYAMAFTSSADRKAVTLVGLSTSEWMQIASQNGPTMTT